MPDNANSIKELVAKSISDAPLATATIRGREDEPAMIAYAEYGTMWTENSCATTEGLAKIKVYHEQVTDNYCAAWMDNTTISTAIKLLSDEGPQIITPLTLWDLSTFIRSIVGYQKIYHHEHPDIDNGKLNRLLGEEIFVAIPLPFEPESPNSPLPETWNGAHLFMCELWFQSVNWLKMLHSAVGTDTLNGTLLAQVTKSWQTALGKEALNPLMLVDYVDVDRRWQSPSNRLISETVDITTVSDTNFALDPTERFQKLFANSPIHKELAEEQRYAVLSDLNLRSYVNQRIAEFFSLPYASSFGRLPFRNHLYNRSSKIQQELITARAIDDRYAELAKSSRLRLPVFLSLAIKEARRPSDVWEAINELRAESLNFRQHRVEMDRLLEKGNLKETENLGKALKTTVESLLKMAGKATTDAGGEVLNDISKGGIPGVSTAISAAVAAGKGVLKSSFTQRLLWRLRKPQLLWVNNIIDESREMTESMPDFTRIWEIPVNQQSTFSERFRKMENLMK